MKNFNGSSNYNAANQNPNLVEFGVVDRECWSREWHHGLDGSIIGFYGIHENREQVQAEYDAKCQAKAQFAKEIREYQQELRDRVKEAYKALVTKYGKQRLADLFKNRQNFNDFDYIFTSLDGKVLVLRTLKPGTTVVDFDIRINKNGGLCR